jgi:alpha-galactosidase
MKTKLQFKGQNTPRPFSNYFLCKFLIIFITMPLMLLTQCQTKKAASSETGQAFHKWAPTPPMGWNSWDCYGPTVVEDEVKANADYMAAHLKKFGWEYIVVDIR